MQANKSGQGSPVADQVAAAHDMSAERWEDSHGSNKPVQARQTCNARKQESMQQAKEARIASRQGRHAYASKQGSMPKAKEE